MQMTGRNDSILISSITQAVIQLGLKRVIMVLPAMIAYILYKNGEEKNIKVWTSRTPC